MKFSVIGLFLILALVTVLNFYHVVPLLPCIPNPYLLNFSYGATDDPKQYDDWVKCMICNNWYHLTCAEDSGLIDDDENFFCVVCL